MPDNTVYGNRQSCCKQPLMPNKNPQCKPGGVMFFKLWSVCQIIEWKSWFVVAQRYWIILCRWCWLMVRCD